MGKNIDNSVIYEINLFDNVLVSFDENGQEKLKRDNAKNNKAKFYIQFKKILIIIIIVTDLIMTWLLL